MYLWTGYWSLSAEYLNRENLDPLNIPFCSAVTVLWLYGLWRALRQNAAAPLPYLLVLLFFPAIYYVTHPEVWYRRPIDPQVVVLAVYGLTERFPGRTIGLDGREHHAHTKHQGRNGSARRLEYP